MTWATSDDGREHTAEGQYGSFRVVYEPDLDRWRAYGFNRQSGLYKTPEDAKAWCEIQERALLI